MRRALLVLALCLAAGAAGAQTSKIKGGRPAWAELTVEQQHTLAPLKAERLTWKFRILITPGNLIR